MFCVPPSLFVPSRIGIALAWSRLEGGARAAKFDKYSDDLRRSICRISIKCIAKIYPLLKDITPPPTPAQPPPPLLSLATSTLTNNRKKGQRRDLPTGGHYLTQYVHKSSSESIGIRLRGRVHPTKAGTCTGTRGDGYIAAKGQTAHIQARRSP